MTKTYLFLSHLVSFCIFVYRKCVQICVQVNRRYGKYKFLSGHPFDKRGIAPPLKIAIRHKHKTAFISLGISLMPEQYNSFYSLIPVSVFAFYKKSR